MRVNRNRPVRAVVVEGFLTRLGFGMVTFALPLYALELGMSLAEIGLLVAAKAMIEPAVKPFVGQAVDRWGARRGYLVAVLARLVASVLLFTATTPLALYGVRLAQGAASAATAPPAISVIASSTKRKVGKAFSLSYSAKDLGAVTAGAVGGALLAATGDFRLLWALVTVLAALAALVVWLWVPPGLDAGAPKPPAASATGGTAPPDGIAGDPTPPTTEPEVSAPAAEPPRLLRDRRLRLLCAFGLCAGLTAHLTHGLFPVIASEVAGMGPGQIGALYSASIVVLLVAGPVAGWIADRFGAMSLAGVRGIANTASSLTYLVAPTAAGITAGRMLDEAGKAAFRPTWGVLLADASRAAGYRSGRVTAGLDAMLSVGQALGPLVAALLWDFWGLTVFLLVRAALGIATELVITRRLRRSLRAHPWQQPQPVTALPPWRRGDA